MVAFYDSLLILVICGYLYIAPFTKVEESFNIHAIHDIIQNGVKDISKYDHIEFPGAVPRTFIGSLIIAAITKPILYCFPSTASKLDAQLIARGVLGIFNAFGIVGLKNALVQQMRKENSHRQITDEIKIKKQFNSDPMKVTKSVNHEGNFLGFWYTLFQLTQFHLNFYASRTLPNFFALPLTNYAFAKVISGDYLTAISIFAFTSVVFRVEIVALTLAVGLFLYLYKKVTINQLIKSGLIGASIGSVLSLTIDSYFWGRITIPEVESFVFNVIEGKSSEWGTQPFAQYFTKFTVAIFLPLVVPLLAVLGTWKDITRSKSLKIISLGSLLFVTLISFQGHKEWRFVAYVIPVVNLAAANGASYLTAKASKSLFYKFVILGILSSTFISLALSVTWAHVSSFNYPGGFAITAFHEKILTNAIQNNASDIVTVHFDVPTAMTGATKFNELVPTGGVHVIYDKTEDPTELATLWDSFDYLITEVDLERDHSGKTIPNSDKYHWNLLDFTEAYEGIDRKAFKTLDPVRVVVELIQKKNLDPIGKAVYPFLRLKKALFIYEKVEN